MRRTLRNGRAWCVRILGGAQLHGSPNFSRYKDFCSRLNACDAHILAVDSSLVHVSVAHWDRLYVSPWRAYERAQYILCDTLYFYIPSERTVEILWVASYAASSATIATKSIIAILCEIGYFADCVFSGVRTPLFPIFTNPAKIVQSGKFEGLGLELVSRNLTLGSPAEICARANSPTRVGVGTSKTLILTF